jgi:acyl CoA:acetate/3-ketoacid CoA transferase beta subunit
LLVAVDGVEVCEHDHYRVGESYRLRGSDRLGRFCRVPHPHRVSFCYDATQAVFEIDRKAGKMTLIELMPGATLEEVKAKTGAKFEIGAGIEEKQV